MCVRSNGLCVPSLYRRELSCRFVVFVVPPTRVSAFLNTTATVIATAATYSNKNDRHTSLT